MKPTASKSIAVFQSLIFFGAAAALLFLVTNLGIPYLRNLIMLPDVAIWFILGGCAVFVPLFLTAIIGIKQEGIKTGRDNIYSRLRLRRMTNQDIYWTAGVIVFSGALSWLIIKSSEIIHSKWSWISAIDTSPSFMKAEALKPGEDWILLLWLFCFFFNIFGEEMLWRGFMLPRQEIAFGKNAWIVNGMMWTIFHFSFGIGMVMMLIPLLFALPYVVQRQKNTWIGIIAHGLINGPAMILILLGII